MALIRILVGESNIQPAASFDRAHALALSMKIERAGTKSRKPAMAAPHLGERLLGRLGRQRRTEFWRVLCDLQERLQFRLDELR